MPVEPTEDFRYGVGVDRGASSIRLGLVRSDGTILKAMKEQDPPRSLAELESTILRMTQTLSRFLVLPEVQSVPLDGVGAVAGGIINHRGTMIEVTL